MIRAAILLPLALAGCASSGKLASGPAVMTLQTARPAAEVEQCIALVFSGDGMAQTSREGDRRYITVGSREHAAYLVTIMGDGPATVEVRQAFAPEPRSTGANPRVC